MTMSCGILQMGKHGKSSIEHSLSLLLILEMLDWDLPPTDSIRTGWLPWDHEWREKDKEFDGKKEHGLRPR
ncbi:unnamed protein product, partial [Prunus brigantina]